MKMPFIEGRELESYLEHLEELRWRIIFVIVLFSVGFFVSFYFVDRIVLLLQEPLKGYTLKLYYFKPYEKFMAYIKVALFVDLMVIAPYAVYHLGAFIWPALKKNEKKYISVVIFIIPIMFLMGAFFSYKIIAPSAFSFFIKFSEGDNILPMWSFGEYFDLLISMLFMSGLVFEFPVVLVSLMKLGIVKPKTLTKFRRHIVVLIAVFAGIFSPGPDIVSQIMLGVPLYLLFELSLLIGKCFSDKEDRVYKEIYGKADKYKA